MEEEITRTQWLLHTRLLISNLKKTRDSLTGNGHYIMAEFVNWEGAGPTFIWALNLLLKNLKDTKVLFVKKAKKNPRCYIFIF